MNTKRTVRTRRILSQPLSLWGMGLFTAVLIGVIPAQQGPPSFDDLDQAPVEVTAAVDPDLGPAFGRRPGSGRGFGPGYGRGFGPGQGLGQGLGQRLGRGIAGDVRGIGRTLVGNVSISYVLSPEVREKIALTDEQVEALEAKQYDHQRAMIELEARQELTELDLRRLLDTTGDLDRDKVMDQIDAVGALRAEQQKLAVDCHLTVREILTDEQSKQVRELVQERLEARRDSVRETVADAGRRRGISGPGADRPRFGRQRGPGNDDAPRGGGQGRGGNGPRRQRADAPDAPDAE
jgi:hypothetical protein